jgi:hypothetical protein
MNNKIPKARALINFEYITEEWANLLVDHFDKHLSLVEMGIHIPTATDKFCMQLIAEEPDAFYDLVPDFENRPTGRFIRHANERKEKSCLTTLSYR